MSMKESMEYDSRPSLNRKNLKDNLIRFDGQRSKLKVTVTYYANV